MGRLIEECVLINTQGLDEGIRCAMCTNSMANDRGCDGSCVVNEAMYKKVLDTIQHHVIADYENRLKADMLAMLTEILTDFDNLIEPNSTRIDCESIIEQKIQTLEGKSDEEK